MQDGMAFTSLNGRRMAEYSPKNRNALMYLDLPNKT
jgi:hypothetical protein